MTKNTMIQDAFDEFMMRAHAMSEETEDIGATLTDAVIEKNLKIAQGWGMENLPGGLSSADDSDWWFLSFSNCIVQGLLNVDPTYLTREYRLAAFKAFSNTVSAATYKAIYRNDESYIQKLSQEQRDVLATLGGQKGFKRLVNYKETPRG
jgi:hypothetical protein